MKVMHIRSAFEDNGPGSQSLTLGIELRRRGHEVFYVTSGGLLVNRIVDKGFDVRRVPELSLNKRDLISAVEAVRKIARILRDEVPDVIHSHNAQVTFVAWAAARVAGIRPRLVRSVRGIEVRPGIAQVRNLVYRFYPACMLAVSEFTKAELIKVGAPADRITVTYNGVDMDRFDPGRFDRDSIRQRLGIGSSLVVGHVGAFSGWKGQEVLVRAIAKLRGTIPDTRLMLVGDGPARAEVERVARDEGVASSVHFVGFTTDVEQYHVAFDIYAQPSTKGEMLPNSILESMAMGNPWVGSKLSGLGELSADGQAGLLSEPGDVDGLASNLRQLLCDDARRRRMGSAARLSVLEKFTIAKVMDRIVSVYEH